MYGKSREEDGDEWKSLDSIGASHYSIFVDLLFQTSEQKKRKRERECQHFGIKRERDYDD